MTCASYFTWRPSWIELSYGIFKAVWRTVGRSAYAEFITEEESVSDWRGVGNPNQLKLSVQLNLATCSTLLKILQTCSLLLKKLLNVLSMMEKILDNLPVMSTVWLHFDSYLAWLWLWRSCTSLTVKSVLASFISSGLKLEKAFQVEWEVRVRKTIQFFRISYSRKSVPELLT